MIFTADLRRQHEDSIRRIKEIFTYLSPETLSGNAQQVRTLLSTLIGKASIHRAVEDEYLYPKLIQHESPEMRNLAKKYYDGFIGSKDVLSNYSRKWIVSKIKENPYEFIAETKVVLNKVLDRIDKENNELFTLADKLLVSTNP